MPTTSVKGHAGKMVMGEIDGKRVICLAGRVHGYEGTNIFLNPLKKNRL
jgi:purine-nucleoside phosphorylase